jgi:hypothetical protein
MDYAKLLYAAEVRKLALGLANSAVPTHFDTEERLEFIQENYEEYVQTAMIEIEHTSILMDKIRSRCGLFSRCGAGSHQGSFTRRLPDGIKLWNGNLLEFNWIVKRILDGRLRFFNCTGHQHCVGNTIAAICNFLRPFQIVGATFSCSQTCECLRGEIIAQGHACLRWDPVFVLHASLAWGRRFAEFDTARGWKRGGV